MTIQHKTVGKGQPSLQSLTAKYLSGTGRSTEILESGEFEAHEVLGGFQTPTATTWSEATAVFRFFGLKPEPLPMPPEWASVRSVESRLTVIPCGAGLFPQLVRKLPEGNCPKVFTSDTSKVPGFASLRTWLGRSMKSRSAVQILTASGVALLLGEDAEAKRLLESAESLCEGALRKVWENQKGVVAWCSGNNAEAVAIWKALESDAVVSFNRALACWSSGQPSASEFQLAADALPETSGWSHLARLYATCS